MKALRRILFAALVCVALTPTVAHPDAGLVVLRETRGPLVVTLMAGPVPLRAGPVEFEALVQSRASGAPELDATTTLHLTGPARHAPLHAHRRASAHIQAPLESGARGNRLLQSALVDLRPAGAWQVAVVVRDAEGRAEQFEAVLDLAPPRPPALRHWAAIAAGPMGLVLLALHQALSLTRRTRLRAARQREARVDTE